MHLPHFFALWATLSLLCACGDKPAQAETTPADPAGLAVEQLTARSARLSWTAAGDADTYYVFARPEHEVYAPRFALHELTQTFLSRLHHVLEVVLFANGQRQAR